MAQPRRRYFSPRTGPISVDFDSRTKDSLLFSILPSVVQSRLPRLPSLRRSASVYGFTTPQKSTDSIANSAPSSGTSTPRPGYMNAMILRSAEDDVVGSSGESVSSDEEHLHSTNKQPVTMELTESESRISWKFANQGFNLLSHAVDESTSISEDRRFGNAVFARQLYVHAITYLLRALPADLTPEEQLSVRSSLPSGIVESPRYTQQGYLIGPATSADHDRSVLHRTLASAVVQMFILFRIVLPYLKTFLAAAYQYERKHKISEKVLSQSLETVDSFGKVTGAVYGLNDGKFGQAITEAVAWFVDGVTGGIHEGIGEGMMILGATRSFKGRPQR